MLPIQSAYYFWGTSKGVSPCCMSGQGRTYHSYSMRFIPSCEIVFDSRALQRFSETTVFQECHSFLQARNPCHLVHTFCRNWTASTPSGLHLLALQFPASADRGMVSYGIRSVVSTEFSTTLFELACIEYVVLVVRSTFKPQPSTGLRTTQSVRISMTNRGEKEQVRQGPVHTGHADVQSRCPKFLPQHPV